MSRSSVREIAVSKLGWNWYRTARRREPVVNSQAADLYGEGIEKPVPRYDECLNSNGGYVEK